MRSCRCSVVTISTLSPVYLYCILVKRSKNVMVTRALAEKFPDRGGGNGKNKTEK